MSVLAIDPAFGKNSAIGWAIIDDGTPPKITRVGIVRVGKNAPTNATDRAVWTAGEMQVAVGDEAFDKVLIEFPVVRPTTPRAADIVNLAASCGAIAFALDPQKTTFISPERWKGTVRKNIMCERIIKKLDEGERKLLDVIKPRSLAHNAIDAIGIALYAVGRLRG